MKRNFLFFILCCLPIMTTAQQYYPFPTNNAVWRESRSETYGASNSIFRNFQNFINGDTVFSGKIYHKIYKTGYNYGMNGGGDFSHSYVNEYVGAIREDSSKRVFFYGNHEVLLYDFNIQIGDTLPQIYVDTIPAMYGTYNQSNFIYSVNSIDSVLVSGVYHKRFKIVYANGNGNLYLIEGIGASTGLISYFSGSYTWGYSTTLICFKQNNIDAYPEGVSCSLVGIDNISLKKQIFFYPNPSNGLINFNGMPNEIYGIQIFNLIGEIICEIEGVKHKEMINLSFLPKGIFYIKVLSKNQSSIIERIVIQ